MTNASTKKVAAGLLAVSAGRRTIEGLMAATGLPRGTVASALRELHKAGLLGLGTRAAQLGGPARPLPCYTIRNRQRLQALANE